MSTELAPRLTISEAVRVYVRASEDIRGGFARIAAAEHALNETFASSSATISVTHGSRPLDWADPDRTLEGIRHDVWAALVDRLEVRRMMSTSRWTELQRQIAKHELPEITEESVSQLVRGFQGNLETMLREAVEEVFSWLRPRRQDYKTNSLLEVGPKVVLTYVVEQWGKYVSRWHLNYRRDQELIALENVFTALDGRGQIAKASYSAIALAIRADDFDGVGETPYFKFKTYKNGNMHLEFRRLDLLARFNAIAGGKRLRPAEPVRREEERIA